MYLAYITRWKECIEIDAARGEVRIPLALFQHIIALIGRSGAVDEEWYKSSYEDVQEACHTGMVKDAFAHFGESGFFEGRRPANYSVDENWYARKYPDVKAAIASGEIASSQGHYVSSGYAEGRVPNLGIESEVNIWNDLFASLKKKYPNNISVAMNRISQYVGNDIFYNNSKQLCCVRKYANEIG